MPTTTTTTTTPVTNPVAALAPAAVVEDMLSAHQAILVSREHERERASQRAQERQLHRLMNQTPASRCMDMVCRLAILPFLFLFIILTLVITAIFCGIPFILFMGTTIVIYYCCTRNPIPPGILFRALMSADPDHWNHNHPHHPNHHHHHHGHGGIGGIGGIGGLGGGGGPNSRWTNDEIRASLIRRELLETVVLPSTTNTSTTTTNRMPHPHSPHKPEDSVNLLEDHTVSSPVWLETPDGQRLYLFTAPLPSVTPNTPDSTTTIHHVHNTNTTAMVPLFLASDGGTRVAATAAAAAAAAATAPGTTTMVASVAVTPPSPSPLVEPDTYVDDNYYEPDGGANIEFLTSPSSAYDPPYVVDVNVHVDDDDPVTNSDSDEEVVFSHQDDDVETGGVPAAAAPNPEDVAVHISHPDADDLDPNDHSYLPGSTCDICLLSYEPGDIVAWSRNVDCPHYFHEDCITDWLRRKPTCCSCRREYLVVPEDVTAKPQAPPPPLLTDADADVDNADAVTNETAAAAANETAAAAANETAAAAANEAAAAAGEEQV
jgi:hypothetical protein